MPSNDLSITSWNVNSINARLDRVFHYLQNEKPNVLCFQELKCVEEKFPEAELAELGYQSVVFGQQRYNGVAIIADQTMTNVRRGIGHNYSGPHGDDSRVLSVDIAGVTVVCVYAPNGKDVTHPGFEQKLTWYEAFCDYLEATLAMNEKTVVLGDFNIVPEAIDSHDENDGIFHTEQERDALQQIINLGFVDSYRVNSQKQEFSWWDYRRLAFPKGHGLRIDLALVSKPLVESCKTSVIHREHRKAKLQGLEQTETKPSDHAPIMIELAVEPQGLQT